MLSLLVCCAGLLAPALAPLSTSAEIVPTVEAPALAWPGSQRHAKRAPFTAVRWRGDTPEVEIDGTFVELLSIDGHEASELVAFAKAEHKSRWQKRIAEDLVQVMTEFGHKPGDTVDLEVLSLGEGAKPKTLKAVAMTEANRRAAWEYNNRANVDAEKSMDSEPPARLTARDVSRDLATLAELLRTTHSYFTLNAVDLDAEIEAIEQRAEKGMDRGSFGLEVACLLAKLGDGHTRVTESTGKLCPKGRSPFLVFDSEAGPIAVAEDRSGPLIDGYPLLVSIDGIAIERWLDASTALSSGYSKSFARIQAVKNLRYLGWVADELGHELGREIEVVVANAAGETSERRVPVDGRRALYGAWPRALPSQLPADVGYLRIPSMDRSQEAIDGALKQLAACADAKTVIVDARGNGGGTRDLLRALYPLLAPLDSGPRVVNAARYRLRPGEKAGNEDGYLENRSLFPATWKGWSKAEFAAVDAFLEDFEPAWNPPATGFSALHFMVLAPAAEGHFDGQVKVLIDAGCFSATDIFVSAFKGLPNVQLIGETTGGGSGRSRRVQLDLSRLGLKISSMVSYQKDGQLYDGVGVAPDLAVRQPPEFFWVGRDAVLEAAIGR